MFVDDVKLFASKRAHLTAQLQVVEVVSSDIGMEFGIEKCKTLHVEKGKWVQSAEAESLNGELLDVLQENETYKYLGFQQNTRIDHSATKEQLKTKFKTRLE